MIFFSFLLDNRQRCGTIKGNYFKGLNMEVMKNQDWVVKEAGYGI